MRCRTGALHTNLQHPAQLFERRDEGFRRLRAVQTCDGVGSLLALDLGNGPAALQALESRLERLALQLRDLGVQVGAVLR